MLFGKNKKQHELEQLELEKLKQEKEEQQRKLQAEREAAEQKAAEEAKLAARKSSPYKFSVPNPMPKELVSVLCDMFKKLFPDAVKAYLVLTQYEDKSGYLLVVDIDPKFHKIINIYLDGETRKVRNGLPIECILYSKSGDLTYGMKPFYEKAGSDAPKPVPEFKISDSVLGNDEFEVPGFEDIISDLDTTVAVKPEPTEPEPESAVEESSSDAASVVKEEVSENENDGSENSEVQTTDAEVNQETANPLTDTKAVDVTTEKTDEPEDDNAEPKDIPELEINKTPVKVVPETKQQLFALMNRAASESNEESLRIAIDGFSEYTFYIPFECANAENEKNPITEFPPESKLILLLNRDNGIKAAAFFTDEEPALNFAKEKQCSVATVKYKDYKAAYEAGVVVAPAAEGLIINPDGEQLLLPPDYPLL